MSSSILSLFSFASSDASSSMLGILYGQTATTSSVNPIAALQTAVANETKDIAQTAAEPQVARDIAHFRTVVGGAKNVQAVLADPVARKVLLTANGLGDQTDYAALATKALTSDTTKSGSLASKLTDTRWLTMAQTYDFANKGLSVLQKSSVMDTIASGYAEVTWRQSLDQQTPGLSNAIDFKERAATVTSVDQILGDANLRAVVTTALGIPVQIAFQPIEAQEKAITDRLDISKLKDSSFVDQFAKRYLIQQSANSSSATSSVATSLLSGLIA